MKALPEGAPLSPNDPEPILWATWIRNRAPQMKVYTKRGHASSSIAYRKSYNYPDIGEVLYSYGSDCVMYEFEDGAWKVIRVHYRGDKYE